LFTSNDLKELGARLVKLREERGLSAAYVAHEVLGYSNGSHVAVTRLERGILPQPRRDHLEKLAAYYEVEPSRLMIEKTAESAPVTAPAVAKPAEKAPVKAPVKAHVKASVKPGPQPKAAKRVPDTFAGRVQHIREMAELDEREFAQELSKHGAIITTINVSSWESGEREANPIQLRALARYSKRSEDWFLTGRDAKDAEVPRTGAWLGWTSAPPTARL
jgi:transcriptional regulator with XRE-family HTH domain